FDLDVFQEQEQLNNTAIMNRAIAPVLATVCGVATAVAAFQPELQKQAAEREGKNVEQFQEQHGGAM
ncbi:unnamed protein product, partial [Aureobasidium pullulans]